MTPAVFPMNTPVQIQDQETISEVIGLMNDHILGRLPEHPEIEISILSNSDLDAPSDLPPPMRGERIFQIDLWVDGGRLRFIVSTLGRAGSELIGYTSDELRKAEIELGNAITTLRREGRVSADSLSALWECQTMLDVPYGTPSRWQPFAPTDVVVMHAIYWPEGAN